MTEKGKKDRHAAKKHASSRGKKKELFGVGNKRSGKGETETGNQPAITPERTSTR